MSENRLRHRPVKVNFLTGTRAHGDACWVTRGKAATAVRFFEKHTMRQGSSSLPGGMMML